MQRDRSNIEASLKRKGFRDVSGKNRAKDHRYYQFYVNGRGVGAVVTKVSSGTSYKSLGDSLLGLMAKQCLLSKEQFVALVDCPLSEAQYQTILSDQGVRLADPTAPSETSSE